MREVPSNMTSRTYEGSDASEEAAVCAALKVDVRSAVKMRIKDRMMKGGNMCKEPKNPDRWLHGRIAENHEIEKGIARHSRVDSGAVLPGPHHLNLTSSAQWASLMAMQPTSGVAVTG